MRVIFVFECDSSSQTDSMYVHKFLKYRYPHYEGRLSVKTVFLKGKGNYGKSEARINGLIHEYKSQNKKDPRCEVVFCFDTDCGGDKASLNPSILGYCRSKGYRLVWFHRDVEEVFLGNRLKSQDKVKMAMSFYNRGDCSALPKSVFGQSSFVDPPFRRTNLVAVLDEILSDFM